MTNEGTKISQGITTPILMSAKKWTWKHISGPHVIDVPLPGGMLDVDDDIDVHIDFSSLIRDMLGASLYPVLEVNHVFAISDILVDRGSKTVSIVGNVLEQLFS